MSEERPGQGPLEHQVRPHAWRVRGYAQFKTGTPGPWRYFDGPTKPIVNSPEECDIEPLHATPQGWRIARDGMNRIVVTMPDGGGCAVHNVANDARTLPEEVLFALCKALGA